MRVLRNLHWSLFGSRDEQELSAYPPAFVAGRGLRRTVGLLDRAFTSHSRRAQQHTVLSLVTFRVIVYGYVEHRSLVRRRRRNKGCVAAVASFSVTHVTARAH